jgi:hypothetical protein
VVDGTGLENRHTRKGIGGSNPSLSAISILLQISPLAANSNEPAQGLLSLIEALTLLTPYQALKSQAEPVKPRQMRDYRPRKPLKSQLVSAIARGSPVAVVILKPAASSRAATPTLPAVTPKSAKHRTSQ